jgi:hypothetical protein
LTQAWLGSLRKELVNCVAPGELADVLTVAIARELAAFA